MGRGPADDPGDQCSAAGDRKSTRLNSSHSQISYAVFCLKKKKKTASPSHSSKSHFNEKLIATLAPNATACLSFVNSTGMPVELTFAVPHVTVHYTCIHSTITALHVILLFANNTVTVVTMMSLCFSVTYRRHTQWQTMIIYIIMLFIFITQISIFFFFFFFK